MSQNTITTLESVSPQVGLLVLFFLWKRIAAIERRIDEIQELILNIIWQTKKDNITPLPLNLGEDAPQDTNTTSLYKK